MDDNKQKALAAALAQIEKQFGKGSIMKLGDNRTMDIETISTGSLAMPKTVNEYRLSMAYLTKDAVILMAYSRVLCLPVPTLLF